MTTDHYRELLRRYWGYDDFRGIQRQIIESIGAGHDTLGLMPTGGGKSITFQVPALAQEGTCLVITPLIALMKDQVQALRRRGIKASAVYSGMQHDAILTVLENAVFGQVKILYISPERLASPLFRTKLRHIRVSFICVDEAHCISQWGYDFRPSYLTIADIRHDLPDTPVLALTATATPAVVDDIQRRLGFPRPCVFRMSFERRNLAYIVRHTDNKRAELCHILDNIAGSAIVYVRSRRRTRETAEMLQQAGISATFFHAGLDTPTKDRRQREWQEGQTRVMVATNAFGMGIDKPDVRVVVHIDCPDSIEAYFQEAGRAGRDGEKAYAVMLYDRADIGKLHRRVADNFPEKDYIRQVYDHLAYYYQVGVGSGFHAMFEFAVDDFCAKFRHFPVQVHSALKILERAGYIEYIEEQESQARVMFLLERDQLYQLQYTDETEERVITAMLRNYGGLFVDYKFIDEALIASETGLTRLQVYQTLKQLAQRRVIGFIPQKRVPYVRYIQRRELSEHLLFPPAVYDDLRQRFADRIAAMISYIETTNECRSRKLLRYFGERNGHDCGHCDVCAARSSESGANQAKRAVEAITQLLADGRPHPIDELHRLPLPYTEIEAALRLMAAEEAICLCGSQISSPNPSRPA